MIKSTTYRTYRTYLNRISIIDTKLPLKILTLHNMRIKFNEPIFGCARCAKDLFAIYSLFLITASNITVEKATGCVSSSDTPHLIIFHSLKMTQNDMKCHIESYLGDENVWGEGCQYSWRTLYWQNTGSTDECIRSNYADNLPLVLVISLSHCIKKWDRKLTNQWMATNLSIQNYNQSETA